MEYMYRITKPAGIYEGCTNLRKQDRVLLLLSGVISSTKECL